MPFETRDFKETLRILAIQRQIERWPKAMEDAFVDAQDVRTELDALSAPAQQHPETGGIVQRRKIRAVRTGHDIDVIFGEKNGERFVTSGSSLFLDYLTTFDPVRFASYFQAFRDKYCGKKPEEFRNIFLSEAKAKFPYRLIDLLLQDNPLIATAVYARYLTQVEELNTHEEEHEQHENQDWQELLSDVPEIYYYLTAVECELCLELIDDFFAKLKERIDDELTQDFVQDLQRDLSEVILESLRIFFRMVYKGSERYAKGKRVRARPGDDALSAASRAMTAGLNPVYFFSRFTFPVSEKDYTARRSDIEALVKRMIEANPDPFEYSIEESEPFQHSFEEFMNQDPKASYQLAIPYVLSWIDIQVFLEEYLLFWKGLNDNIAAISPVNVHKKTGRTHIDFSDGTNILLRPTPVTVDGKKKDARIFMKGPGDEEGSIDFRIDRDTFTQSLSLDYGRLSFEQVLALMNEVVKAIELKKTRRPSAMESRVLFSSPVAHGETREKEGVFMSNKLAFFISAVLNSTIRLFEKSGDHGTTYHVRGAIAQEVYYNNFAHIVSQIETALSGR